MKRLFCAILSPVHPALSRQIPPAPPSQFNVHLHWGVSRLGHALTGSEVEPWGDATYLLLTVNLWLLVWRVAMRAIMTGRQHGPGHGLLAVPRILTANFIALLAVRRAIVRYVGVLRGAEQRWDKTEHVFPDTLPS